MSEIDFQTTIPSSTVDLVKRSGLSKVVQRQNLNSGSQPSEKPLMVHREMSRLVEQVDRFVKSLSTKVSFSVDEQTGKQIIIVSEKETGKIIRQIPPEEMLDLAKKMEEIGGIIFNGRV